MFILKNNYLKKGLKNVRRRKEANKRRKRVKIIKKKHRFKKRIL